MLEAVNKVLKARRLTIERKETTECLDQDIMCTLVSLFFSLNT